MPRQPPPTPAPPGRARWETLFDELTGLAEPARSRRLAELRGEDGELAARLERLLAADAASTDLLDRPPSLALFADDSGMDGETDGGVPMADLEPQLAAGTIVGSWRLIGLLGRGGMGEVYVAERSDPSLNQKVALKVIKRGMDSRAIVQRFLRERQILAALEHPNLARLLDGGTGPDGRLFFAMELVDGEPITAFCEHHGVDLAGRLRLIQSVCRAVDSAHRRLVVHRDLKPANILVTADGTVKLLDFGIAKLLAEEEEEGQTLTRVGGRVLTPAYAAPEQLLGEPVSTATDVYALGVLLYELITGLLPHRREQREISALLATLDRETTERPSAALERQSSDRRLARRVAGDLDIVVLTALHRDPARRYPSAQALADDIGRFLAGRPILARPDTLRYRVGKFVGRHRVPVAAVGIGLAALVVGLGLSLWQGHEARLAARRAAAEARRAERVKSFLVSIFKQSDPETGEGTKLTARELLQHGAASLESELAGEPEVQADLLTAVAQIEVNMSLPDQALAHAQRALALRLATLPASDGRVGVARSVVGEALRTAGKEPAAREAYGAALKVLIPAYGEQSLEVATVRRELAVTLPMPQSSHEAVALLRQALAVFRQRFGEDSDEVATALHFLGFDLEMDQQYAAAEAAYRRSAAVFERRFGKGSYAVANVQSDLASLLDRVGRGAEARPLMESAIAIQRAVLGPHALRLGDTVFSYGLMLLTQGEYDAGERQLKETMAIVGPDHFLYSHALRTQGELATRRGNYRQAIDLLTAAIASYRRTLGDDHIQTWRARNDLGWAHFKSGQVRLAQEELTAGVAAIERLVGPDSYEMPRPLEYLGQAQLADQPARAVVALRRARLLNQKILHGAVRRDVVVVDVYLARALLAAGAGGDRREARQLLDESLDLGGRLKPPDDELRGQALLASGGLALGDGDKARARRELAAAQPLLAKSRGTAAGDADAAAARRLLAAAGGPP